MPADVNNHYHDDAEPWLSQSDGRMYATVHSRDTFAIHMLS